MKKYYCVFCLTFLVLLSCRQDPKKKAVKELDPSTKNTPVLTLQSNAKGKALLDTLTRIYGTAHRMAATVQFQLKANTYRIKRNCGQFEFVQISVNSDKDTLVSKLTNTGFKQRVNGAEQKLSSNKERQSKEVLATLVRKAEFPFGLNSITVRKRYLGDEQVGRKWYEKIKIAFIRFYADPVDIQQSILWIDKENKTLTYTAAYRGAHQEKLRFQKLINPREINGIRFVDYELYRPKSDTLTLEDAARAFQQNQLKKMKSINFTAIKVELSDRKCG